MLLSPHWGYTYRQELWFLASDNLLTEADGSKVSISADAPHCDLYPYPHPAPSQFGAPGAPGVPPVPVFG